MYQGEQIPTTTIKLKKMDSDLPLYKTTLDLSYYIVQKKMILLTNREFYTKKYPGALCIKREWDGGDREWEGEER